MAAVRELIGLACDGCKRRNYTTTKNKKRQTDKFSIKKFCPSCRSHTLHRECKIT
jgi:large subunit ribosomal protein L33